MESVLLRPWIAPPREFAPETDLYVYHRKAMQYVYEPHLTFSSRRSTPTQPAVHPTPSPGVRNCPPPRRAKAQLFYGRVNHLLTTHLVGRTGGD
jgi:hypothetical protein